MTNSTYILSESALYRKFSEELIVIQAESGHFYYFSQNTEKYLDFFRTPHSLNDLIANFGDISSDSQEHLEQFVKSLVEKEILEPTEKEANSSESFLFEYSKPVFLRTGEKTLDQITFLCP